MFAMLYIARMDAFAGVDRVERLKEVILKVGENLLMSSPASLVVSPYKTQKRSEAFDNVVRSFQAVLMLSSTSL